MFILSILSCNNINHKKTTKLLEPPVVDLYSADWCYWCDQSEKFLKDNKIKYAKCFCFFICLSCQTPTSSHVFRKIEHFSGEGDITKTAVFHLNVGILENGLL